MGMFGFKSSNVRNQILRELMKNGYSLNGNNKTWEVNDPKFLYMTDVLGEGFLTLQQYDILRAKVTDIERSLIEKHAQVFVNSAGMKSFNLIDLGCGDGTQALTFLKAINGNFKIRYCPFDVNSGFVKKASDTIKKAKLKNVVDVKPFVEEFSRLYEVTGMLRNNEFQHNVILLLGNTLAHYEINDFLFRLGRRTLHGDFVIIGNGIRTGERFVSIDKYKDKHFDDWLSLFMKEVGFKGNEIKYNARFANSRLEFFYTLLADKGLSVDGKALKFKRGDEIVVSMLYKYYEKELNKFCKMYFNNVKLVKDPKSEYALVFCKK